MNFAQYYLNTLAILLIIFGFIQGFIVNIYLLCIYYILYKTCDIWYMYIIYKYIKCPFICIICIIGRDWWDKGHTIHSTEFSIWLNYLKLRNHDMMDISKKGVIHLHSPPLTPLFLAKPIGTWIYGVKNSHNIINSLFPYPLVDILVGTFSDLKSKVWMKAWSVFGKLIFIFSLSSMPLLDVFRQLRQKKRLQNGEIV